MAAVASAPAAIEAGFVRAQEAARSAAVVLENIPRTVQEIPLEVRVISILCASRTDGDHLQIQFYICRLTGGRSGGY